MSAWVFWGGMALSLQACLTCLFLHWVRTTGPSYPVWGMHEDLEEGD